MRELMSAMEDPNCDPERFNELDTEFHVAIAEGGGNRLVADMTIAVRESVQRLLLQAFHALGDSWTPTADGLRQDHRSIYDALEAGDGAAAQQRMENHILGFWEVCTSVEQT